MKVERGGQRGERERERERKRIIKKKKRLKGVTVNFHIWKFTIAKLMETFYFKVFVGRVKWLIIAKYNYNKPYKWSVGDALKRPCLRIMDNPLIFSPSLSFVTLPSTWIFFFSL